MIIKKVSEKNLVDFLSKEWRCYNQKYTKIKYKKDKYYFGAFQKQKIIGCITIEINGGVCYVKDFLIADGFRRKGIGEKLWHEVETLAKRKKCRKIAIKTNELNKMAIKFYKKHGLKTDAVLKNYQFGLRWYFMSKEVKK